MNQITLKILMHILSPTCIAPGVLFVSGRPPSELKQQMLSLVTGGTQISLGWCFAARRPCVCRLESHHYILNKQLNL